MQAMTTSAVTVEEQLATMARAIEKLTKTMEEKDLQIASLMNKLKAQTVGDTSQDASHPPGFTPQGVIIGDQNGKLIMSDQGIKLKQQVDTNRVSSSNPGGGAKLNHATSAALSIGESTQPTSIASVSVQQLHNMITNTIRAQYGGPSHSSYMYSKPYTKRIDYFRITRRTVSMTELTNTKQWKDEPVVDYINRWGAISLDCKDRLSELSAVEMCMNGMHWGLLYILQGIKPKTFEELATRAHDMEISIANHGGKNLPILEKPNDKRDVKKGDKFSKGTTKDSMMVTTAPVKITAKDKKEKLKRNSALWKKTSELLVDLASQNKILLDLNEAAESNHTTIVVGSQGSPKSDQKAKEEKLTLTVGAVAKTIQFGSLEPVIIQVQSQDVSAFSYADKNASTDADDGWILVTRKKSRKNKPNAKPVRPRRGHGKKKHHQHTKRKGRRKMKAEKDVLEVRKPIEHNPLAPITLRDFFPTGYFKDDEVEAVYMVSTSEEITEDEEQNYAEKAVTNKEVSLLTTLKEAPPRFSNPTEYKAIINEVGGTKEDPTTCASCCAALTFTDEDQQLDAKFYMESDVIPQVIPTEIPSMGQGKLKKDEQITAPNLQKDANTSEKPPKLVPSQKESSSFGVQAVYISAKGKSKTANGQHITIEEVEEDDNQQSSPRVSVFDRIEAPVTRTSVFDRLGVTKETRKESTLPTKKSIFSRLGNRSTSSKGENIKGKGKSIEIDSSKGDEETRSSIPSRMKRITSPDVDTEGPLKVKRRTIVLTGQPKGQARVAKKEEMEYATSYHVEVEEHSSSDSEDDDFPEAPPQLEDGGQPTVDDLKELNLGTLDEPRAIFVSALPSPEEEKAYFDLLLEYRDVFAWTYKEMPGLSPKVVVHHLGI
ncbi:hypothetical protein Vadar_000484 [Vaccinium darrowii]|uniref:Uncharacterized protein n=1 Tax=Vaccinium darrowii TaxID=229202 RepID=A0ACB7YAR9_9ERIC|nr:hypothetical protein Vadar_000484 [Vaccinium darrowii]